MINVSLGANQIILHCPKYHYTARYILNITNSFYDNEIKSCYLIDKFNPIHTGATIVHNSDYCYFDLEITDFHITGTTLSKINLKDWIGNGSIEYKLYEIGIAFPPLHVTTDKLVSSGVFYIKN